MANKKTRYKTITHIPGQIRVVLPNGTKKTFQNSSEAQQFFDENYGKGYSMEITSTTDNNGEVTINGGELPEVLVTGQAPDKPKEPDPVDPIREAIFEGRYNGRKFTPTPDNIQHYLDLYESDKRIAEGYGNKAWGKVLGTHLLAGAGIYGALTAPAWAPVAGRWVMQTGGPAFAKHIAAPTAAGMIWDEGQKALTGTTTTETISNYLQKEKGWNPTVADMAGGLSNPGYWINFGGAGRYTRPLFNKVGLGLPNSSAPIELSPAIQANVNSLIPKSKFQTKVVDPTTQFIDRNLYRFQKITSPWLIGKGATTIQRSDLPRFNFVRNASELKPVGYIDAVKPNNTIDYLLFRSNRNNEKVFGDAMSFRRPNINTTTFHTQDFSGNANTVDRAILSPLLAGVAATDIAFSDDRNPYVRGLEYALLGRFGLQRMIDKRVGHNTELFSNYLSKFNHKAWELDAYFRNGVKTNQPKGYQWHWSGNLDEPSIFVKAGSHNPVNKPGFNYRGATFDDLIRFLDKNSSRIAELRGYSADANTLYGPNGTIIAKRNAEGKIDLFNETELRNILSKDIDIFDYNTGNRVTGRISVGDDGTVTMPEEYTRTLRSNIDYVQNTLFPGSGVKVFGSSAGVTEAGFPHATHDIDFYITQNELDKLLQRGILSESDRINPGTYTYRHNPAQFGEQGNIDLNVIEQTPEGMATGVRAEELYRQYFPDDYFQALRDFKSRQSNGDVDQAFHINKTPEELLEAMNPSSKTIMDSFDIDYTAPAKGKHALRSWAHLVYSDPIQVSQGINQYAQSMLGSRVKLFPMSIEQLGNKELNLQALQKLGINLKDFELDRIASDPQRMKNVLDAWYMMDNTAMRYIRGTWPGTTGYSSENFVKSATIWDPVNNGGNANGAGLNTTIGGDSQHFGDLKAFISPNTQYKSSNLLDLIEEINSNFGRNPEARTLLSRASWGTPEEQVRNLQRIYDEKGWNFLQNGTTYGRGNYASATRPFDINLDFIGFSPTRTVLNPIVPRVRATAESNPLYGSGWNNPFTSRRQVPVGTDYYLARTSSLAPVFKANQDRVTGPYNPLRGFSYMDVPRGNIIALESMIPTTLFGIPYGATYLDESRRKNWIQNAIAQPDDVIQGMPEESRKMFTQEGVDSLYQRYRQSPLYEGADQSDLDRAVYYDLKQQYNNYKNE